MKRLSGINKDEYIFVHEKEKDRYTLVYPDEAEDYMTEYNNGKVEFYTAVKSVAETDINEVLRVITEYYEDEEDDTYDENEYEDDDYEEDEEENYEEDDEEELRTAKITSRSRRGNIDDRLAKYKKKMNEEKQSKGFLGFFKDRKNKQF